MNIDVLANVIDVVLVGFIIFTGLVIVSGSAADSAKKNNRFYAYAITDKLFVLFTILMTLTAIAWPVLTLIYFVLVLKS